MVQRFQYIRVSIKRIFPCQLYYLHEILDQDFLPKISCQLDGLIPATNITFKAFRIVVDGKLYLSGTFQNREFRRHFPGKTCIRLNK